MIPVIVITLYLIVISYIGSVAFKKGKENTEDFFLASRTIGSVVFFLSLFATNMTAFAILGSSGAAYKQGIGIFGMMASASGIVIPLTIFFIGTRLWSLGKRFGHITQVQLFRDRWECGGIGTFIFALTASMLIPYMIISIIGGGQVLQDISKVNGNPLIPYWLGCLIVTAVVTINVFFGGMRGVVWVNVFQTILFVLFGTVAFITISTHLPGGLSNFLADMAGNPVTGSLLSREKMPAEIFWSYMFIPLSSIMFPHMAIMCLSARKMSAFKQTVVVYPIAIMAIWLPCVFLGVIGAQVIPGLKGTESDGILLHLLTQYAPTWLAGLLGAGIISAVMGSDCHQVLALSTMFTKDVFAYYGGTEKYGEKGMVFFARIFVIIVTALAYAIALAKPTSIFELAIRFAFSGYAALAPVMIAALFWKRSTKYGALASTVWVAFCMVFVGYLTNISDDMAPKPPTPAAITGKPRGTAPAGAPSQVAQAPAGSPTASPTKGAPTGAKSGGKPKGPPQVQIIPALGNTFLRSPTQVTVFGFLPVVPMVLGSALLMILVSLMTRPPSPETVRKYFPEKGS